MAEVKKYNVPRDVLLHLLSIVALYASAFSFGDLLFNFIDRFFPDLLDYGAPIGNRIRNALATLTIFFPVYFFITRFLNRIYIVPHDGREPWIRRWSIYLTLFVSALVIIGDLITLLRTYLDGELTVRFLLKVVIVLFIALVVFRYYFWSLRMKESRDITTLSWIATLAVAAVVVGGFIFSGSPFKERARRFDERRINDLQIIQNQVIDYWVRKNELPPELLALQNDITGFSAPRDPETGTTYDYKILEPLKFELCASFTAASQITSILPKSRSPIPVDIHGRESANWNHEAGRACFRRTIDPSFYRREKELTPPTR